MICVRDEVYRSLAKSLDICVRRVYTESNGFPDLPAVAMLDARRRALALLASVREQSTEAILAFSKMIQEDGERAMATVEKHTHDQVDRVKDWAIAVHSFDVINVIKAKIKELNKE